MTVRSSWPAMLIVGVLVAGLYLLAALAVSVAGMPRDVALPWYIRILGTPLVVLGLGAVAWVLRFRGPAEVLDSTFVTLRKLLGRIPVASPGGRAEPLVVAGPYRVMRHPLYSGVIALVFGIALLVDRTFSWIGAGALLLWFEFILAPFEERELIALFGEPYREYMAVTRRFLPVRRSARPR